MRENDDGRKAVRTGGYPLATGNRVVALVDGASGTVLAVDEAADVFAVGWDDTCGDPVTYSSSALGINLRKTLPWET